MIVKKIEDRNLIHNIQKDEESIMFKSMNSSSNKQEHEQIVKSIKKSKSNEDIEFKDKEAYLDESIHASQLDDISELDSQEMNK